MNTNSLHFSSKPVVTALRSNPRPGHIPKLSYFHKAQPVQILPGHARFVPRANAYESALLKCFKSPSVQLKPAALKEYQTIQQHVNAVFCVLCLLEVYGFFNSKDSQGLLEVQSKPDHLATKQQAIKQQAINKVQKFLDLRLLQPQSQKRYVNLQSSLELIRQKSQLASFNSVDPQTALAELFEQKVMDLPVPVSGLLQSEQRFDKRWTGLAHTMIRSEPNEGLPKMIELCKTFAVSHKNNLTLAQYAQKLVRDPERQHLVKIYIDSQEQVLAQVILGRGGQSHGVVLGRRIADDVTDGELVAIKKVKESKQEKSAENEIISAKAVRRYLQNSNVADVDRHFVLPEFAVHTQGADKSEKSYVVMPLAVDPDFEAEIKSLQENFQRGSLQWQTAHWQAVQRVIKLVDYFEAHKITHPDLKPANVIGGRALDVGGLWMGNAGRMRFHTKAFVPPEALKQSVFRGSQMQAYDRFALGVMLIQSLEGCLPSQLFPSHPLHLRILAQGSKHDGVHSEGFSDFVAPSVDPVTDRLYTHYEQVVMIAAKGLAQNAPERRVAPRQVLDVLNRVYNTP